MAKVTSKRQLTVPKAIADQYGIRPGDKVDLEPAGDAIRLIPQGRRTRTFDVQTRLRIFDEATKRQRRRETGGQKKSPPTDRGWTRDELYTRGSPR